MIGTALLLITSSTLVAFSWTNFLYIPVGIPLHGLPQGTSLLACVKTHTHDEGPGTTQGVGVGLCCDTCGFTRATA